MAAKQPIPKLPPAPKQKVSITTNNSKKAPTTKPIKTSMNSCKSC